MNEFFILIRLKGVTIYQKKLGIGVFFGQGPLLLSGMYIVGNPKCALSHDPINSHMYPKTKKPTCMSDCCLDIRPGIYLL